MKTPKTAPKPRTPEGKVPTTVPHPGKVENVAACKGSYALSGAHMCATTRKKGR